MRGYKELHDKNLVESLFKNGRTTLLMDVEGSFADLEGILSRSRNGFTDEDRRTFNLGLVDLMVDIDRGKPSKIHDARLRVLSAAGKYIEHVATPYAQDYLFKLVGVLVEANIPNRDFYDKLIEPDHTGNKMLLMDTDAIDQLYMGLPQVRAEGVLFIRYIDTITQQRGATKPPWLLLHRGEEVENPFEMGVEEYEDDDELKLSIQRHMRLGNKVTILRYSPKHQIYRIVPRAEAKKIYAP